MGRAARGIVPRHGIPWDEHLWLSLAKKSRLILSETRNYLSALLLLQGAPEQALKW
jgi:hypothetical protein